MSYDNQGEEDGGAVLIWGAFLFFILMCILLTIWNPDVEAIGAFIHKVFFN